jgi:uncharacterized membrane protein YidH (DUF202 family)
VVLTLGRTEIGLLLLGLSILSFGFWLMPLEALLSALGLAESLLASEFSEFLINTILSCPAIALTVAGLIMYFRGGEAFWKTANKRYSVQLVLLLIGMILVVLGASLALLTYQTSVYYAGKPTRPGKTLTEYLFRNSPYFIWFGLWIIAGVTLLLDFFAHERTDK